MGKGDKKTKKGKIFMGSFGVTRAQKAKKATATATSTKATTTEGAEKKSAAKKAKVKKEE